MFFLIPIEGKDSLTHDLALNDANIIKSDEKITLTKTKEYKGEIKKKIKTQR